MRWTARQGLGALVAALAVLAQTGSALAADQTVTATSGNQFSPSSVVINQGDTVTWNNGGGLHNVHFDDNSYDMPATPSAAAWSVSRTFSTLGTFRYYCEAHGGPNGVGMSGVVSVNGPGYPRPRGATPHRTSLAPAYKACTVPNRTHGAPLNFGSCTPPVQASDFLTVGTPEANLVGANSIGTVLLQVLAAPDVRFSASITDVRRRTTGLPDYTGELQGRLPLRITDTLNGPSLNEPATGDTTFSFTIPCAGTDLGTVGSTCSVVTTANSIAPGAVVSGKRAIWAIENVQVFDGGSDGVASTAGNTLFADQAVFVP